MPSRRPLYTGRAFALLVRHYNSVEAARDAIRREADRRISALPFRDRMSCPIPVSENVRIGVARAIVRLAKLKRASRFVRCRRCTRFLRMGTDEIAWCHSDYEGYWCEDCTDTCPRCSQLYGREYGTYVLDVAQTWCERCYDSNVFFCEWCESCYSLAFDTAVVEGDTICISCRETHAHYCLECEEWVGSEHDHEQDFDPPPRDERINGFNFRPTPVFHTDSEVNDGFTHVGLELEIEAVEGDLSALLDVSESDPALRTAFYWKHDGSLINGAEWVSHPLAPGWLRKHKGEIDAMLQNMVKAGGRSFLTRTCGMHIHVDRRVFWSSLHLYKFMYLIYQNPGLTLLISQRRPTALKQWASLLEGKPRKDAVNVLAKKAINLNYNESNGTALDWRYVAVNLQRKTTVELRIYRGTLKPESFWKNIEHALATVEYARDASMKALDAVSFLSWLDKQVKRYPHLHAFLSAKSWAECMSIEDGHWLRPIDVDLSDGLTSEEGAC